MKVDLDSVISGSTVITVADGVISSDLNGEVVILNMKNGNYYGLDEVGYRIWTLVQDQESSIGEIQGVVVEEYNVNPEGCEQDLLELIEQLIKEELFEVKSEAGS